MKKFFSSLLILCSILCSISCGSKNKNDSDGLEIDISKFKVWSGNCSFDSSTKTYITKDTSSSMGLDIDKSVDSSKYNCVKIEYTSKNYGFFVDLIYKDSSGKEVQDEFYCPSNLTEFVMPLNDSYASNLNKIKIYGLWCHTIEIQLDSITLLNLDNPGPSVTWTKGDPLKDTGPQKNFTFNGDAWDFLPKMGAGFQYTVTGGYTYGIDFGIDSGYAWGYTKETSKIIKAIKAKGFKTLRLQVTGNFHLMDSNYNMDPAFMKQLKEIVDCAISEGMYVIIVEGCCSYYYPASVDPVKNSWIENHLFGAGYNINNNDKTRSEKYLKAFWNQISAAFNNSYDEHLVFELMNEPIDLTDHQFNPESSCPTCKADVELLNSLNQLCLNTIRASGGNNAKRYIMIPTIGQASYYNDFKMPTDTATKKLIVSIHLYPLGSNPEWIKILDGEDYDTIKREAIVEPFAAYDNFNSQFIEKRIPLAITEIGYSRWISETKRRTCVTDFMSEVNKTGRSCMFSLHENCAINTGDNFCYLNKETLTWYDSSFIDDMIRLVK